MTPLLMIVGAGALIAVLAMREGASQRREAPRGPERRWIVYGRLDQFGAMRSRDPQAEAFPMSPENSSAAFVAVERAIEGYEVVRLGEPPEAIFPTYDALYLLSVDPETMTPPPALVAEVEK